MHSIRRVGLTTIALLTMVLSVQAQEAPKAAVDDQEGQHNAAKKAAAAAASAAKSAAKQAPAKTSESDLKTVDGKKLKPNWNSTKLRIPKMGFPWIEHHGYMR